MGGPWLWPQAARTSSCRKLLVIQHSPSCCSQSLGSRVYVETLEYHRKMKQSHLHSICRRFSVLQYSDRKLSFANWAWGKQIQFSLVPRFLSSLGCTSCWNWLVLWEKSKKENYKQIQLVEVLKFSYRSSEIVIYALFAVVQYFVQCGLKQVCIFCLLF